MMSVSHQRRPDTEEDTMAPERCALGHGTHQAGGGLAGAHSAEGHLEADSRGLR